MINLKREWVWKQMTFIKWREIYNMKCKEELRRIRWLSRIAMLSGNCSQKTSKTRKSWNRIQGSSRRTQYWRRPVKFSVAMRRVAASHRSQVGRVGLLGLVITSQVGKILQGRKRSSLCSSSARSLSRVSSESSVTSSITGRLWRTHWSPRSSREGQSWEIPQREFSEWRILNIGMVGSR